MCPASSSINKTRLQPKQPDVKSRKLAQVLGFGSLALRLWRAIIAALWTQVSAHSVCFGLERPVAASVFDVGGAYVTVP